MNYVTTPELARFFIARNYEEFKALSFSRLQDFEKVAKKLEKYARSEYEQLLGDYLKELIREQEEDQSIKSESGSA